MAETAGGADDGRLRAIEKRLQSLFRTAEADTAGRIAAARAASEERLAAARSAAETIEFGWRLLDLAEIRHTLSERERQEHHRIKRLIARRRTAAGATRS